MKPYSLLFGDEFGMARVALCEHMAQAAQARDDGCHAAVLRNAQTVGWHDDMVANMNKPGFSSLGKTPRIAQEALDSFETAGLVDAEFLSMNAEIPEHTRDFVHVDEYEGNGLGEQFVAMLTGVPTTRLLAQLPRYEQGVDNDAYYIAPDKSRLPLNTLGERDCKALSLDMFTPQAGSMLFLFAVNGITMAHIVPGFSGYRPRLVWEKRTP